MRLLKQESKIRKMQMAVVHAHSGRMGPCQFSWLPSEAPDCGFIEARKLWAAHRSKEGKGFHCAEVPLVLWKEELKYNLNA